MLRFHHRHDQAPADPGGPPFAARGETDERAEQRRAEAARRDETHYIHPTWLALAAGADRRRK